MNKYTTLMFVFACVLTLVGVQDASASSAQPQIPACPLTASGDDILVDFGYDMRLFANDDFGANRNSGIVPASIPSGDYKVQLASWDGHNDRLPQTSSREYYHVELLHGSQVVAKSNHTKDLKDGVLSATWSGVVNTKLHVAQDITRVKAQHSAYFYAADANSVSALCAVFTPIHKDAQCNPKTNGKVLDAKPTKDLCNVGTPSDISGTGTSSDPWKWTCEGQGSAADASCSAQKKQSVVEMASCPYTASGNDILIDFKGEARLFSQESWHSPSYTKDASVPAGTYRVKLASWDGHADRVDQVQPREYFHIELLNGSQVVAKSNHSQDLTDQVLEATWSGTVNDRLDVPQNTNRVKAMHSAYVDNSSGNSVSALCAILTPIVEISCGDGVIQGAEQCDDGNTTNGDGCSSQCSIERTPVDEPEEEPKKCRASIGDTVWNDRNKNGVQDNGEEGISGVRIKLYRGNDVDYDRTDSEGKYKFKDLCAGKYTVVVAQETVSDGCYLVADPDGTLDGKKTLRVTRKEKVRDVDFGFYCPSSRVYRTSPATGPGAAAATSAGLATLFASGAVWLNHRRTKRNTTKA